MKKLYIALMSVFIYSISLSALTIQEDSIVDERGNKIKNKHYNKIVVLDPAVVESLYFIQGEGSIVAIADTAKTPIWPQEKTKSLPKAGNIMKPSIEKVMSFNPDLVILNAMSEGFGESLRNHKINYIVNEGKKIDDILTNLEVFGAIAGKEDNAKIVAKEYREKLSTIKQTISKNPLNLKGGFLFSTSPMMIFSQKSLPGEIFEILGIENISKGLPGSRPIVSSEYLLRENPDILVCSMSIESKEDIIRNNPIIERIKAGQKGNIFIIESDKILRATPRIIDALEELYKELNNVK
ncbi:MAG: ABC transporter substrate-binding protein [Fusobacteriaceae bacterium]